MFNQQQKTANDMFKEYLKRLQFMCAIWLDIFEHSLRHGV